ncbi:MAG TPA: hypothetical protein PLJ26_00205 [Candidatus Omnitrophota bacterium]|nr:hypothetical protein [Candidatus Omnitrophota bacterium]HQJ14893.1 hypothetical protein [Candidatus Omnitrophota bacterium]
MIKKIMPPVTVILLILTGITGFSVYKYAVSMQEKAGLQTELEQVRQEISRIEQVRDNLKNDLVLAREYEQRLVLENTGLKSQIKDDQVKFSMLEAAIAEAQGQVDALAEQISVARQENAALVVQLDGMKAQLLNASREKESMQATLSSVDALKRAIKDLRRKTRLARKASSITVVVDEKKQVRQIILGNKGYIIRDGKMVKPERVKIEVQPSAGEGQ